MQITTPKSREGRSFRLITLLPSWFPDRIGWTGLDGWICAASGMNEWMKIWDENMKNDPVVNLLKGRPRKEGA